MGAAIASQPYLDDGKVTIRTRNGDWTARFPFIADAPPELRSRP